MWSAGTHNRLNRSSDSLLNDARTEADDKDAPLGAGQVALKFLAAPINVADLSQIQGAYAIRPKFPAVGGNEGVAVVTAVGSGVSNVKVNDRVIPTQAAFGACLCCL